MRGQFAPARPGTAAFKGWLDRESNSDGIRLPDRVGLFNLKGDRHGRES
jgi:hypothetical protein